MIRERPDPDTLLAEEVQRGMDERTEAAYLLDVVLEGQRAGMAGAAAGANPHTDIRSREYDAWEKGRNAGEAARLARALERRVA